MSQNQTSVINSLPIIAGGVAMIVGLFSADVCLTIVGGVCYAVSIFNAHQVSK